MSKVLEKINKQALEGMDWMTVYVDSVSGSFISASKLPETQQKINALCQEMKVIVSKIKRLTNEYSDICSEIHSVENEIGFEETQLQVQHQIKEEMSKTIESMFNIDREFIEQKNLFNDYDTWGMKKVAIRKMLQSMIVKEIKKGKK